MQPNRQINPLTPEQILGVLRGPRPRRPWGVCAAAFTVAGALACALAASLMWR